MSDYVEVPTNDGLRTQMIDAPTLIHHDSAHSIVFRDQLRRQSSYAYSKGQSSQSDRSLQHRSQSDRMRSLSIGSSHSGRPLDDDGTNTQSETGSVSSSAGVLADNSSIQIQPNDTDLTPRIIITHINPTIEPLEPLPLTSSDTFEPLLYSTPFDQERNELWNENLSQTERDIVTLIQNENCVVKTIKNQEWMDFLHRFRKVDTDTQETNRGISILQSFKTSTTLLPSGGIKMRCYGSPREYSHGVIFSLPRTFPGYQDEDTAANLAGVWCWPSGYSAKTEFNIDHNGNLINGREAALVSLTQLRKMNHSYIHDDDYGKNISESTWFFSLSLTHSNSDFTLEIAGRLVRGGLKTVPYNEVYIRVGGFGRCVDQAEALIKPNVVTCGSFVDGIGPPIALFTRTATYGDLIGLIRTRSKIGSILGKASIQALPLLMISPETGVRILTENLQRELLRIMSSELNPFQNPLLQYKTSIDNSSELHLQEKKDELFNLDDDNIRGVLTADECARIAGGE
jgi:hypothetical protein